MVWDIFKIVCRVYSGVMAVVVLVQMIGAGLTGGLRITEADIGPMSQTSAVTLFLWVVAILVTVFTKREA